MSKRTFQEMISEAKGDQEIDAPEPSTAGAPQGGRSGKYSRETANKKGALLQLRSLLACSALDPIFSFPALFAPFSLLQLFLL